MTPIPKPNIPGDATRAARAGVESDRHHFSVMPPLHLSVNFAFEGLGRRREYDYTRSGNPTRDELARALAGLEQGAGAVVTSSGMSAIALCVEAFTRPGDLVVAPHDCYGGTHRLLTALAKKGRIRSSLTPGPGPGGGPGVGPGVGPALVWLETPSNPLLRVVDIAAEAAAAHAAGALVVVDNTFLSPILQKPLTLGADFVVHSTTKYLNGHGDVVGGAVIAKDPARLAELAWWANALGITGAPFDSYMTLRGLRTLPARIRVHQENARAVARALRAHPAVSAVHYPGFARGRAREIVQRQQKGPGAMISFELAGGLEAASAFVGALRRFTLAESLGGVESLVAHPATMTHASMDPPARARAGITDGLVRLSVGIEDRRDLVDDLDSALAAAARPHRAAVSRACRA